MRSKSAQILHHFLIAFAIVMATLCSHDCLAENGRTYTVGIVPQFETSQIYATWVPILDALSKQTGYDFEVIGSPSIPEFEKQFAAGLFDFVYMNPCHVLLANNEQGYVPLVRDVDSGVHGVVVVRKGTVGSVEELYGKKLAFPAPNALGASLLVRDALDNDFKIRYQPKYVKSHSSVYLNVVLGLVDAGGGIQKSLQRQPKHIQDQLDVIYRTREVASHPLAVHPRVPVKVYDEIRTAMLQFSQTEEGAGMFGNVPIGRLGVASYTDYQSLNEFKLGRYDAPE